MDSQEEKSQHNQHCIDDPHEYTDIPLWGKRVDSMMDRPEVPPKAKWLGVLKMEIPTAVKISPRLKIRKKIRLSFVNIFFFISFTLLLWIS